MRPPTVRIRVPRTRTLRDVLLIFLGAAAMRLASSFLDAFKDDYTQSVIVNTHIDTQSPRGDKIRLPWPAWKSRTPTVYHEQPERDLVRSATSVDAPPFMDIVGDFPETVILSHAPGWTVFKHLYMSNGTLFIITDSPASGFPDIKYITSTGLPADATPESEQARMPTPENMDFITPAAARLRWGADPDRAEHDRVWNIRGTTWFFNDPDQFLGHYYHVAAELLFGAWAFWSGVFSAHVDPAHAGLTTAPGVDHIIFAHADWFGWRDGPGLNAWILRALFPAAHVEAQDDWEERVEFTVPRTARPRAYHFDTVLLADRSAAFRGEACGARTQRTAASALEHVQAAGSLMQLWWEPVRRGVLRSAGVDERVMDIGVRAQAAAALAGTRDATTVLPSAQDVVITYVRRHGMRRVLLERDHDALVQALEAMCVQHEWELNVVRAEKLSIEQQLELVARTTILVSLHGNALTHLIMMPVTPVSAVIEIFYPQGFAHDYQWTSTALGLRHFAVWNDTFMTLPEKPDVHYPDEFQGTQIPVYAPTVVKIIEDRLAGHFP